MQDHTALVAVERSTHPDPEREGRTCYHFAARHIHRWELGTTYPKIVADVKALFTDTPLSGSYLVVDQTGVGRAVVDMLRAASLACVMYPLIITGGEHAGGGTVPKKSLVAAVQVPLQARRVTIASSLPLAETLGAELEQFRVRVTASRNEVFESWRERDHDDLVLSLALAMYVGGLGGGYHYSSGG